MSWVQNLFASFLNSLKADVYSCVFLESSFIGNPAGEHTQNARPHTTFTVRTEMQRPPSFHGDESCSQGPGTAGLGSEQPDEGLTGCHYSHKLQSVASVQETSIQATAGLSPESLKLRCCSNITQSGNCNSEELLSTCSESRPR